MNKNSANSVLDRIWRNESKELPEKEFRGNPFFKVPEPYIVYVAGRECIFLAAWVPGEKRFRHYSNQNTIYGVTHWMPIPNPPAFD